MAGKTMQDVLTERGLNASGMPRQEQRPVGPEFALAGTLSVAAPMDAPTDERAAAPTIEELLLSSDEPLRCLAMPEDAGMWGVFLGFKQVPSEFGESVGSLDWAQKRGLALERWRAAVRAQRAEPAPAELTDTHIGEISGLAAAFTDDAEVRP